MLKFTIYGGCGSGKLKKKYEFSVRWKLYLLQKVVYTVQDMYQTWHLLFDLNESRYNITLLEKNAKDAKPDIYGIPSLSLI